MDLHRYLLREQIQSKTDLPDEEQRHLISIVEECDHLATIGKRIRQRILKWESEHPGVTASTNDLMNYLSRLGI
ncbi:MAG: hypothetical protein AAF191_02195 [Verrucomicrobiota bacterium]